MNFIYLFTRSLFKGAIGISCNINSAEIGLESKYILNNKIKSCFPIIVS
jgi:hypothetical protein